MDNYLGYTHLDLLLTQFIKDYPEINQLDWKLMSDEEIKKITVPTKDFNKRVVEAYSVYVGEHDLKDMKADLFYVFGKYIRKDFYSKSKFDEKIDYFFTMYAISKQNQDTFLPAKYVINQREYKSWLIDMLDKGDRYKTSLEVKERSNKIKQLFTKVNELWKVNSKSKGSSENDTDLEDLF